MKKGAFNRNKHYSKPPQQSLSRRRVTWPKVNSVPVRKQKISRRLAALKIQKVFRGFLVRKSVNKISSVRNELLKLEQRINNNDFINSIRDDDKERLRLNETIMSLLFKLDSVRGVDIGVRNYRKSVTKKAIELQEKLDLIAGGQHSPPPPPPPPPAAIDDDSSSNNNNEYCSKDILEKMISENNDKMMKLMIRQMSERNDMQTRMIDSLSRRVEQLEKAAFVNNDDQLGRTNNNETNTDDR